MHLKMKNYEDWNSLIINTHNFAFVMAIYFLRDNYKSIRYCSIDSLMFNW